VTQAAVDGFTPVEEYMPSYGAGDLSLGEDFATVATPALAKPDSLYAEEDHSQRLLVEVQRSLDVWDRTWSSLPLNGLRVYACERSAELAQWLTQQMGQHVSPLDVASLFKGFEGASPDDQAACLPLLGVFLRTEGLSS
jgi:MSHA biogenesis protein MshI